MERRTGPASVHVGGYRVLVDTARPAALDHYRGGAELVHTLGSVGSGYALVAVTGPEEDQASLVEGNFAVEGGRGPGVLVVPDRLQVFVGAGRVLAAFDRRDGHWQRTWTDEAEAGFWDWAQHGDVVLMAAELELAAWTTDGTKLWSRFVEPPWSFSVLDERVRLDVMGCVSNLSLREGE